MTPIKHTDYVCPRLASRQSPGGALTEAAPGASTEEGSKDDVLGQVSGPLQLQLIPYQSLPLREVIFQWGSGCVCTSLLKGTSPLIGCSKRETVETINSKNVPFCETNFFFSVFQVDPSATHPARVPARWRSSSTVPRRVRETVLHFLNVRSHLQQGLRTGKKAKAPKRKRLLWGLCHCILEQGPGPHISEPSKLFPFTHGPYYWLQYGVSFFPYNKLYVQIHGPLASFIFKCTKWKK